ncbi:alcohol oxidase [Colletotrichum somersetense]|nr:alcohol oxidase [Colletotrichum somersetense]
MSLAAAGSPDEYDYIIIGSGPGGGSLAANLATSGNSVFLIEAGGDRSEDLRQVLPILSGNAAETPGHSWQFFVEHYADPEVARRNPRYTYRTINGTLYYGLEPPSGAEPLGVMYPRGATLGGSSQVNAMNFIWAPDNEWDNIANLTGDYSWHHDQMRRHFMDLENCTYVPGGTEGHGFEGYLDSSLGDASGLLANQNAARFMSEFFLEAEGAEIDSTESMTELFNRDINGAPNDRYQGGFIFNTPAAVSPTIGGRSSIARYIKSIVAAGHPLTISFHSLATRVLTRKSFWGKPKAYGVEYIVGEGLYSADGRYDPSQTAETRTVKAKKEVIVSGGAFNTPQILMLSGIGPRSELEKHNIPIVADVPAVGNFLQDNYEVPFGIEAEEPWVNEGESPCTNTFNENDPCFLQWQETRDGPYASRAGLSAITRTSVSYNNDSDILYLTVPGLGGFGGFYPGFSNRTVSPTSWGFPIVKMQTRNTAGTVRLRSTDPREAPAINFNYFSENAETDFQAVSEAMDLLRRAFDATGIMYEVVYPDPSMDLRQSIMDLAFSHHATSSCRMGPTSDPDYCVDSKFRVNGVDKLRVVDASVFPRSPGGMPNGPTFTISRKAYEVIMEGS